MSSLYVGWLFSRSDGSIGFDVVPTGEYTSALLPPCLLTKHELEAQSLHCAFVQMTRLSARVLPGIARHDCAGVR
jgi:hypothetical protein